jgi:predicted AlkP superfamily pyrophosphatase or phosphodiesterase
MPTPAENPGMGDLVLYAKNGYAFKAGHAIEEAIPPSTGYLGTHGYPSSDPELDGICIFSGNQIRRGVVLPRISNLDVAPTLARILGLQFPETEGRVLEEFLELTR